MAFNPLSKITSFFSGPRNIGIDVSDFSVEILSLNSRRKVIAFDREILPEGIVLDGEIKNPAYLAGIIKVIIARNKVLKSGRITASFVFPKIKTFISHFEYDESALPEELDEAARKEVAEFFPDSLNNVVWDFAPAGENKNNKDKPQAKRKMLYAVAGKPVVDGYIETAKFMGLKSFSIEIEPILLRRALLPQAPKDSSCLVVDIGANDTSFYIFTPGETIEYTSNTKIGGAKITAEIAERKKISLEEAEKLKLNGSFWDQSMGQIIIDVTTPIRDVISYLIDKHERMNGEKLNKIILSGGGSLLPGFDTYLKNVFSKEVVMGDPTIGLKASADVFGPNTPSILFANVIGSGLKHIHKTSVPKGIDFAPPEYREKSNKNKLLFGAVALFIILSAFGFYLFFKSPPPESAIPEVAAPATAPAEELIEEPADSTHSTSSEQASSPQAEAL